MPSTAPNRPFMVFWASGAMHSPHQVEKKYIEKYRGKFDAGWDAARSEILVRQIQMGVVPEGDYKVPDDTDVFINATSVGLGDAKARLRVAVDSLRADLVVADVVFNPPQTRLLRDAAAQEFPLSAELRKVGLKEPSPRSRGHQHELTVRRLAHCADAQIA